MIKKKTATKKKVATKTTTKRTNVKVTKKTVVKKTAKKTVRRTPKTTVPLIVEPHPKDYIGLPFLTLIQYRKQHMLVIVDNADEETIKAFVLDLCGPESVNEELIIRTAQEWYVTNKQNFPISVEFSRRGLTQETSRIYRSLNVEFVSRIIGPVIKFDMQGAKSVKRRRRKAVPPGVEVLRKIPGVSSEHFPGL